MGLQSGGDLQRVHGALAQLPVPVEQGLDRIPTTPPPNRPHGRLDGPQHTFGPVGSHPGLAEVTFNLARDHSSPAEDNSGLAGSHSSLALGHSTLTEGHSSLAEGNSALAGGHSGLAGVRGAGVRGRRP
ncbi:hypothetical protein ACFCXA_22860 [Streptomyces virginiae]|uniref:hypothetical protein n=1 Tax=Streptomyces virginiae TaxID=1961 RepID=UPI0035E24A11